MHNSLEKMRVYFFAAFLCFILISLSESFIDQEDLSVAVRVLQGKVKVLESQAQCGCNEQAPVFMAALSADLVHCTHLQPVIFDAVKVNRGGGYNNVHGIFTAPVSGIYAFSATLSAMSNNDYHVAFVKGNATNDIGYLYADAQNIWHQRSTAVFTHLNQNEEVWMVCLLDSRIEGDDNQRAIEGANDFHSHMSGFLVSADRRTSPIG